MTYSVAVAGCTGYAGGELLLADEHKSYRAEAEEKAKKYSQ